MQEKMITKTVYVAKDGKEFLGKEECLKYEEFLDRVLSNIQYFSIFCDPDLNETGGFTREIHVAVYSVHSFHKEIAFEWALKRFSYLGVSVQGWGWQPYFSIKEITKEKYMSIELTDFNNRHCNKSQEKVFLSPKKVDGFPENFDYVKEWGFKG